MKLGLSFATAFAVVCGGSSARAAGPVIVSYTAPPECASADAFHELLASEIARAPNPERPWRFSIAIRHDEDYVGTIETESATREIHAPSCDDVTAALALVIATAEPAPTPSPVAPVVQAPPPSSNELPEPDRAAPRHRSLGAWRFGMSGQMWSDGSQLQPVGAELTASYELPWGLSKTMFELGAIAMFRSVLVNATDNGSVSPPAPWLLLDAQVCPIDVPFGGSGFSLLGCGRAVVGSTGSLSAWGGGGG